MADRFQNEWRRGLPLHPLLLVTVQTPPAEMQAHTSAPPQIGRCPTAAQLSRTSAILHLLAPAAAQTSHSPDFRFVPTHTHNLHRTWHCHHHRCRWAPRQQTKARARRERSHHCRPIHLATWHSRHHRAPYTIRAPPRPAAAGGREAMKQTDHHTTQRVDHGRKAMRQTENHATQQVDDGCEALKKYTTMLHTGQTSVVKPQGRHTTPLHN